MFDERLKMIMENCIERGLCFEDGFLKDAGINLIDTKFRRYTGWVNLWDRGRLWCPCKIDHNYVSNRPMNEKEIFDSEFNWSYIYIDNLKEFYIENFCLALEINTGKTFEPFLNDDDMNIL